MSGQQHVLLFTRYPQPGKVKTRLIPRLGPQGAAALHARLTEQAIRSVEPLRQAGEAEPLLCWCGGSEAELRAWLGDTWPLHPQQGGTLGERMERAFAHAWQQGAARALLIGSDCPDLTAAILRRGFALLAAGQELVLGPAADGGYYLIGLRAETREQASLFAGIDWGSGQVLRQTLRQAAKAGLACALLPELHDIDRPEDLAHLDHHPGLQ
ncbi:MAG: TIGR04282 family arsenosugar biosynthesis glycosyltransferase [Candidatus Electronema sp. VV]